MYGILQLQKKVKRMSAAQAWDRSQNCNLKLYIVNTRIHKMILSNQRTSTVVKVVKILKGSLDAIQSPTPLVKIQIVGGKVCFENKKFDDITQQCLALLPQVDFPANDLNFHLR